MEQVKVIAVYSAFMPENIDLIELQEKVNKKFEDSDFTDFTVDVRVEGGDGNIGDESLYFSTIETVVCTEYALSTSCDIHESSFMDEVVKDKELERYKEKYPDVQKSVIWASAKVLQTINVYKQEDLRTYLLSFFPECSIIHCDIDERKITVITSEGYYKEEQRQMSMIPGLLVKMQERSGEVMCNEMYRDKIWTVYAGPQRMGGSWVVWLKGFSGAYSCDLLNIVE